MVVVPCLASRDFRRAVARAAATAGCASFSPPGKSSGLMKSTSNSSRSLCGKRLEAALCAGTGEDMDGFSALARPEWVRPCSERTQDGSYKCADYRLTQP